MTSPREYPVRGVEASDVDAIAALYNHYVAHSIATFEEAPVSAADMQSRMAAVSAAGLPWLVVETTEGVAGYAYAGVWNRRSAYRHTVEVSIYLSPRCTGQGIGERLYRVLFERLRQLPCHVVIAGISLPNPASVALHEKFGMVQVAHFTEVGYKFGQWLDVGYWELRLPISVSVSET